MAPQIALLLGAALLIAGIAGAWMPSIGSAVTSFAPIVAIVGAALAAFALWAMRRDRQRRVLLATICPEVSSVALSQNAPAPTPIAPQPHVTMTITRDPAPSARRRNTEAYASYPLHVLGESEFQAELEAIAEACPDRGPREDSAACRVTALLIPNSDADADYGRIRVEIDGRAVGFLDDGDAHIVADSYRKLASIRGPIEVPALIVGGWRRPDGDNGYYRVRLADGPVGRE